MSGCVPVDQLRALVRFLSPEHMTPIARQQMKALCDEHERAAADERPAPRILPDRRRSASAG